MVYLIDLILTLFLFQTWNSNILFLFFFRYYIQIFYKYKIQISDTSNKRWNVEKWNPKDIILGPIILDEFNWQERWGTISAVFLIKSTIGDQISQTSFIPWNPRNWIRTNRRILTDELIHKFQYNFPKK